MHIFRRSLGLIPLLLGSVGLIVSVAFAVVLWIAGERLEKMNELFFAQSDKWFEMADRQIQRTSSTIDNANDLLLAAEVGLAQDLNAELIKRFLEKPEVKAMENRLQNTIAEIESLVVLIESCEELIREAKKNLSLGLANGGDIATRTLESLDKTRQALLRLLRVASDAQGCWMSLSQGRDVERNAANLSHMNGIIQTQLEEVKGSITELREKFAEERTAWQKLSSVSTRYITVGQYVAVGLCVWVGLGQYALALCGILRLRWRTSSASVPSAAVPHAAEPPHS
jgi:prefoldin subunit 5